MGPAGVSLRTRNSMYSLPRGWEHDCALLRPEIMPEGGQTVQGSHSQWFGGYKVPRASENRPLWGTMSPSSFEILCPGRRLMTGWVGDPALLSVLFAALVLFP